MTGRIRGTVLIILLALAGCGSPGPVSTTQPPASASQPLPIGFRWESFRNLQVGVPDDWGYDTSGSPWCLRRSNEKPYVGRPGAVALVGCSDPNESDGVDPDTVIRTGGEFVWFSFDKKSSAAQGLSGPVRAGDRATVKAAGTTLSVQAPSALREKILGTVHTISADQNGCPVRAPFTGDPQWRPSGPAVTSVTGVKSIAACNYSGAWLTSSVVVRGKEAVAAIKAIADAPVGGGPNSPADQCVPDDLVAMEQLVLQVDANAPAEIGVRYGGCFHRGIDDGTTLRKLTRAAVQPFVGGAHRITEWQGDLGSILAP